MFLMEQSSKILKTLVQWFYKQKPISIKAMKHVIKIAVTNIANEK